MSESIHAINSVIDNLADRLGVAAEHLYPLMIRQAYISGIQALIEIVICIAVVFGTIAFFRKTYFVFDEEGYTKLEKLKSEGREELYYIFSVLFGIAAIIAAIGILFSISTAINALGNPEWFAIQRLLRSLR